MLYEVTVLKNGKEAKLPTPRTRTDIDALLKRGWVLRIQAADPRKEYPNVPR